MLGNLIIVFKVIIITCSINNVHWLTCTVFSLSKTSWREAPSS